MRNFTFKQSGFFRLVLFVLFVLSPLSLFAQVCGTPGVDGPVAVSNSVNTYYPINGNVTLSAGAQSIFLGSVPATDSHKNSFGTIPISVGDLILIVQMQDATINYSDSANYGSGTTNSGPDSAGGTGFTALGNTGIFEYVIATNNVPLGGGNLTFRGTGSNGGTLNSFYNAQVTSERGKRTFQVIRVPQYSNLKLTANITTPPFNGVAGGVIAFNVSGSFDFAGFSIDGSARGFRGGYSPRADSGINDATTYVGKYTEQNISGKGEGIAGTPKYMWDGFNQVVNSEEGLPGGSSGRGAAANAGGGGNDHNTGGGGGGNGGYGGLGGAGWQGAGGAAYSNNNLTGGGRPGSLSYTTITKFPRLIMGGGGGAGDANDASSGVKGGVGGAIILVNAGNVLGNGFIYANGGNGAPGTYSGSPDGAGGGGAGGTVLLNISNNSTSNITIQANGGAGGNTENDANNEHGPGGGGGGGIVYHNLSGTVTISSSVSGGAAGKSDAGKGINHGAKDGTNGYTSTFTVADVPPNLQVNANCFPNLNTTVKTLTTTSVCNSIDEKISYEIQIKNTGAGNAAGVVLDFGFPPGIEFDSATATYSADASGPSGALANTVTTGNTPIFGGFNIAQNGVVTITLIGKVVASINAGTYSSNAQALYLDPTRTATNSTRKITASINGYGNANKTYEVASPSNVVPGENFNGESTALDNVTVLALPAAPEVTTTQPICETPKGTIRVTTPANGSGISYTLTGTSPVTAPIRNATGIFNDLVPGTYKVTTTNAQGCTSAARTDIAINPVTGAPTTTSVTICQDGTGTLTATSLCTVSVTSESRKGKGSISGSTGTTWLDPSNIESNGVNFATSSSSSGRNSNTRNLVASNFGFSIPTNATIKGISVTIGRFASSNIVNYVTDNVVSLIKTGTNITGDNKSLNSTPWSTDNTASSTYGGQTDLWGTTLTPLNVNSSSFGVALSATLTRSISSGSVTASVAYIQVSVSYTVEGVEWYTTSTGGSPIYTGYNFNPVGVANSGLVNTSIAGTTTYYASCIANSSCRTATNFVINPKPTVTGIPASRCGAGTVTLGATASAGTINWYASSTSTTSLGTGTTFVTPTLSQTTTYYIDATDNGCKTSTRTAVTATINTIPTITSTTEASRCGTGSVTLQATESAGTINWYASPTSTESLGTGRTFVTRTLSATTTYYVDAITAEGCSASSRIAVTAVINTASTITLTAGTQSPAVCSGTAISNTVYTFGGSATNAIVSNLPAGLSSVVDTNAKTVTISGTPTAGGTYTITTAGHTSPCTETTISGTVTVNSRPGQPTITVGGATTFCQGGNVVLTSSDGTSYLWSNGVTTKAITVTNSGSYSVQVTNTSGCQSVSSSTVTVTVTAAPNAGTLSGSQSICTGNPTSFSTNGNSGGAWSSSNTSVATVSSSGTVTGVAAGTATITYTVTGTGGCSNASASRTVTVTAAPNAGTLSGSQSICTGSPTSFSTNGNSGGSWSSSNTSVATVSSSGTVTGVAAGTATITYTVTGTGGCSNASASRTVTVTAAPNAGTLSGTQSICTGSPTSFSTNGNSGGAWSSSNTSVATVSSSGTVTGVAAGTATITYTVTGTGGCSNASASRTVTVTAAPNAGTLSGTQSICTGSPTSFSTNGNSGGAWSSSDTSVATVSSSGTVTGVAAGTATITYTVTGTGGCSNASASRTVTVTAAPNAGTLSGTQSICTGSPTSFSTNGNSGGAWSSSDTSVATVSSSGTVTGVAAGTATITYTVTGTGGCSNASASRTVTVTAAPNAGTLSGSQSICTGSPTSFSTNGNSGGAWSSSDTSVATVSSSGTVTGVAAGTATITYTVTGTGGCSNASASRTVTVTAAPNAGTLSGSQSICTGNPTSFSTNGNSGGAWSSSNTSVATVSSSGTVTGVAAGTATITYTVTGTGGCSNASASRTVTVTAAPNAGTLSGSQSICTGSPTSFSTNGNSGGAWSSSDTSVATVSSSGTVTGVAAGTATITYTVTGTGGCSNASASRTVTVTAAPNAGTLSGTQSICTGNPTSFSTNGNSGGAWSSSDTSVATVSSLGTVTGVAAGTATITYTVTGKGGCSNASASRTVTVTAAPNAGTLSGTQSICTGSPTSFSTNGNSGGAWSSSDTSVATVSSSGTVTGVAAGTATITYTVTGTGGCSNASATRTVTVNGIPLAPVVKVVDNCDGTSTLSTTATGDLLWSNNATTSSIIVSTAGTYTVTQTVNGCVSATGSGSASPKMAPVKPVLSSVTQPTCTTPTGSFTIANYNSSYTYAITPNGAILNTVTGVVTGVKGTYTVTATLNNCTSEFSDSVEINSQICAVDDNTYAVQTSGSSASTVGNVRGNDTLNGAQATSSNTTIAAVSSGPLSIDADGVLTLAANTLSGTYKISYTLCEKDALTANCDTAEATVVVKRTIDAVDDNTYAVQTSGSSASTVGNVRGNDTLNGAQATSSNTTITAVSSGPLSIDADGVLTLAANTLSGTYKISYTLCEKDALTANCDTAEATVVVKRIIDAVDDNTYAVQTSGSSASTVGNVRGNDTLNGAQATSSNTTIAAVSSGPLSIDADGVLTLAANTLSGTYKISYTLCEKDALTANCDTAEATVVVKRTIDAVDDNTYAVQTSGSSASTVGNVRGNDTLNGAQATSSNTTIAAVSSGPLSIDADGILTLAANTLSGTYKISYTLCEKDALTANCDTAEATVVVKRTIDAVDDNTYAVQTSGSSASTVGNVRGNDTLNGAQATSSNTTITAVSSGPLSIDADGVLTLAANTLSGTYKISYTLCEKDALTANCDTAEATVVVKRIIDAVDDNTYAVQTSGSSASTVGNVRGNDTLNGAQATSSNTTIAAVSSGPLSIDADGILTLAANTLSGTYKISYTLCEKDALTANCDTAEATVVVKRTIDAVDDNTYAVQTSGSSASTVGNVRGNDTLNGAQATSSNTTIAAVSSGPLSIDADGVLTLAANTLSGTYKISYTLCEKDALTANCDTAEATVVVKRIIDAVDDNTYAVQTSGSSASTVGNVRGNDTLNGAQATSSNTTIAAVSSGPLSIDADGVLTLAANTLSGTYKISYTLCEKDALTANCDTAEATVVVKRIIDAVVDTITPVNGNIGGTTVSLIANDKLNGNPVAIGTTHGEVSISIVGTLPAGLKLNTDGTITVNPNTPKGDYNIEYTICEVGSNPSNCDSVTIIVPVTAGDLVANPDPVGSIIGSDKPQTLVNVLDNDTKNGAKLDPSDVTVSVSTPDPKGYLTLNPDGTVTIGANPPAGDYELTYTICENLNAGNCKSNTVTVTVGLPVIDAVVDIITPINGNIGGTTISLTANDTLNGKSFVVGTNPGEVKLNIVGALPTGLTLNANGTITVAPNTPKGDYTIEYRICENTNPSNCDSVTIIIPVTAGDLVANADPVGSIIGSDKPQTLVNVLDNDTKNGAKLDPSDVTVSVSTPDPKGYLTLNPDGTVTIGANPPAGDYELTYTICENLNAGNCKSNTVTVTVGLPVIDAVVDSISPINGNIGGTTISLTANDTLNGKSFVVGTNPGEVKLNIVGALPTGLTLNTNGTITVAPNTPKGDYTIEYRICENTNPSNCDSVTIIVPVTAGDLVANADPVGSIIGSDKPQTLVNVLDNDTKNGAKLDPSDVTVSVSTPDPKGYLTLNPDGTVTIGANPPAGDYELTYTICENLNAGNCKSNTVTVTVGLPVIDAVVDIITPINGNIGGTTISLTANDTLNGKSFVVGTNPGEVKLNIVGALPTGLTLNANGTITVAPNTPKGDYTIEYRICENTNPSNCDSVTIVVPVTAGDLVANPDPVGSIIGSDKPQTLVNVLDNDTKNGVKLDPSDVTVSVSTPDPKGYLTLNPDGTVTIGANPPAGDYELTYTICENLNAGNCKSNTVTVTVGLPVIDAVVDIITPINGNIGGTTISLTANDTLNGKSFVVGTNLGEVKLNIVGALPTGLTLNANGTITVAPNTPKGDYSIEYRICENTNPSNCDSVTIIVPVTAGDLVANPDPVGSIIGSDKPQTLVNVLDNDTKNGVKLDPSDVTVSVSTPDPKGYLTLNPDGTVTIGANPPAGDYELTYTICENLNAGNCKSNTVTVTVGLPVIDAVVDIITPINGNIGGTTISLTANDTLNGKSFVVGTNPGEVKLNIVGALPTGLTLNANGTITVAPNTPKGDYSIEYRICENTNPSNCDSVTIIVPVTAGDLVANPDPVGSIIGSDKPQTLVNVLDNDTKNGVKLDPSDVTVSVSTPDPKGYLTLNPDGTVTIGANPPAGDYELTYTICENLNAGNCKSNTVTVTVGLPVIDAVVDIITPINGNIGGTTISLTANDTLNGKSFVVGTNPGEVKLNIVGTLPTGLTLNANGTITVAPNTPKGDYSIEYRICENTNPSNCDSVTIIVPVTAGDLVANPDPVGSIIGSDKPQTLVNVLDNDTKNGVKLDPSDVTVSVSTPDPKGYLTLNPDGTVTIGANPPAGDFELTYTICENLNAGNCKSNTVTVTVGLPVIDAVAETLTPSIIGSIGGKTTDSVVDNDTLNGNPVVIGALPGQVKLIAVNIPTGLTLNADGTVTVAINTPSGIYDVEYRICEITNPLNCDSAISKVVVNNGILVANPDVISSVKASNTAKDLGVNIFDNDTKNGNELNPSDVTLLVSKPDPKGFLTISSDGSVSLGANAPAGDYELTYTICEKLNSENCSSNIVKVTVTESTMQVIIANNDEEGPIDVKKGMNATINIFANDLVNGVRPNPSDVILTTVKANSNVVLNADGSVSIDSNTPNGIYEVTYQICDATSTSNCSQPAIVKITVLNSVDPIDPATPNQITLGDDTDISVDGINGDLEFINVLGNDLINGQPINPADVVVKPVTTDAYFEWNADGTVSVKPNTPGKTYTLTYQVCEKADPSNCSTAVLTVFVEVPAIAIVKTATFNDENKDGFANAGETITYKFTVTNTGNVPLKGITISDPLPGVTVSGQSIDLAVNESNETNFTAVYKITQEDINRKTVSNQAIAKGSSSRGVVVEDQSDDSSNSGDNPTVINLDGCTIEVLKAFSPNGDGKNERFYIRGIECYPDNTVEIYNRWGVLVFSIDQYNNTDRAFRGYSNGRSTIKQTEGLPVGTYFYILKYKDSANAPQQKSGYLYINK